MRYGLRKHDAARVGRGEIEATDAIIDGLASILEMPRRWFTEPALERLLPPDMDPEDIREQEEKLAEYRHQYGMLLRATSTAISELAASDATSEQRRRAAAQLAALVERELADPQEALEAVLGETAQRSESSSPSTEESTRAAANE